MRLAFEAVSRRDKAAFLAMCDPEVETVPFRDFPSLLRPEGLRLSGTCSSSFKGRGNKARSTPVELIEAGGDKVVTHAYGEMLGEASGAAVAASVWQVVTFGNGKMLRIDWFADREP